MNNNGFSSRSLIILFLVSGFFYTFSYKLQSSQIVHEGINGSMRKTFFHPYLQGFTFFIGESLCLLFLYYKYGRVTNEKYSPTIFIIPAVSDLFSVMLQCSALAMISGSTYMMLKGASIITTLIFSRWLIRMELKSRHLIGCGMAIIGLIIVGLADIWLNAKPKSSSAEQTNTQAVGYTLMIVSLVFNGFLYAYEQKLLTQYKVSPLEMVGWEGVYGTILSFIIVFVLSFMPCPYIGSKCVYNSQGEAFMELPSVYLLQIFSNFTLFLLVIAGLVSNAFYNFYGVSITQTMDSLTRSLLNVCRTALIWIAGIVISLCVTGEGYQIQSLSWSVNFVKFIGFSCIVSGTLIYNRILFNKYLTQLDQQWFGKDSIRIQLFDKNRMNEQVQLIQINQTKK